jgi:hypothetical protein
VFLASHVGPSIFGAAPVVLNGLSGYGPVALDDAVTHPNSPGAVVAV